MHLAPHLVDEAAFARRMPYALAGYDLLGSNGRPVTFGWLSGDLGPIGVIGDQTGATAEQGAQLSDEGVSFVAAALHEVHRHPPLPA